MEVFVLHSQKLQRRVAGRKKTLIIVVLADGVYYDVRREKGKQSTKMIFSLLPTTQVALFMLDLI